MKIAKIECPNESHIRMLIESDWEMARAQTFFVKEPETIAWIDTFNPDGVFWDIGANVGVYSLYCASRYPNMTIRAFEPMRVNFLRLWQNIFLNDYLNIDAHYMAITKMPGLCSFECKTDVVGSSGGQAGENGYPIPAHTMDFLSVRYGQPNYIKIDTDGNECDIIQGGIKTLSSSRLRGVLVEVNNSHEKISDALLDAGFEYDQFLMGKKNRKSDFNIIFSRK